MNINKSRTLVKIMAITALSATLGFTMIGGELARPVHAASASNAANVSSVFKISDSPTLKGVLQTGLSSTLNQAVTNDGVTLTLTDLIYDGNELVMGIRQEGSTVKTDKTFLDLDKLNISANGKKMYYNTSVSSMPSDPNAVLIGLTKGAIKQQIPDSFELTVKAYVNEVKEPFIFTAPVTKIAGLLSLTPGTTKKSGTFSYTVTSFKMTPLTMQLQLSYKGDFPAPVQKPGRLLYDLADEKGNVFLGVNNGGFPAKPGKEELGYRSFVTVPQSITVKPYVYKLNAKGQLFRDNTGKLAKHYFKDLEMRIYQR
ncbi:DUF4179 domain-containing protein [Paenibacillus rhizoplanae]|uniref:DUF4179 domain-containing protein n=1 Tax=Paenibacillus rhizoplanae TaxID=1917181 RepID=A0ABW5F4G9_9BACL